MSGIADCVRCVRGKREGRGKEEGRKREGRGKEEGKERGGREEGEKRECVMRLRHVGLLHAHTR